MDKDDDTPMWMVMGREKETNAFHYASYRESCKGIALEKYTFDHPNCAPFVIYEIAEWFPVVERTKYVIA